MKHIPLELVQPHFTNQGVRVEKVLEHYKDMQYVGQFALKTRTDYTDFPVDVFYTPTPDISKGHSNYAAFYVDGNKVMVTNGKRVTEQLYTGIVCDDGSVIYPRFQHDFRYFNEEQRNFCDGGWWMKARDIVGHETKESMQTRWGGPLASKLFTIQVIDGKLYNITEDGKNDPSTT